MTGGWRHSVEIYEAKFQIGQLVHHRKFGYRGVIVDVDPVFEASDEWYEEVAKSRPPKDKPWYHVLPDNTANMTYVAERHLEPDTEAAPIKHPAIDQFFEDFDGKQYVGVKNRQ